MACFACESFNRGFLLGHGPPSAALPFETLPTPVAPDLLPEFLHLTDVLFVRIHGKRVFFDYRPCDHSQRQMQEAIDHLRYLEVDDPADR